MEALAKELIDSYRANGFVRVRGIITPEEAETFRRAAEQVLAEATDQSGGRKVFRQIVNTWRMNDTLARLTLHPNITAAAERLAGVKLRLWHDHLLVKEPHNEAPTQFHQDQPYWPHENSTHPISCWVALNDVPAERGCMSFIPGTQHMTDLTRQNLNDAKSLFGLAPQLAWEERVTLPLRAGDCTFHHGRTAHMANANATDEPRYGVSIIFIDATTTYTGANHAVTDPLRNEGRLREGDVIEGELFPLLA